MLRPHYKSIWSAAGCVVVALAGCQSAWTSPPDFSRHEKRRPAMATNAKPAVDPTNPAAFDQQTMARVMGEVREIGLRDPVAQQMLLDKLRTTKPELWPLTVEQFRSSLAYHDQLSQQGSRPAATAAPPGQTWPVAESRPSAELGALVDPRGIRPDPAVEESYATATPAHMPPPYDADVIALASDSLDTPRPLADNTAAAPIKTDDSAPRMAAAPDRFASPPGERSAVELASYASEPQTFDEQLSPRSTPIGGESSLDWRQHVALAIDDLSRRASDSPQSTAEVHQQVSLRLLELLAGDTQQALEPIPKISTAEQDYWSNQIFALATYLDHHAQPDDKRRAAASVSHLDEAVSSLRELGVLSLRNLTFCKQVYDYGAYEPHEEARFLAGAQVTLYIEVENYHSKSTEAGYCTSLGSSYELLDDEGGRVDGGEFPDVEDCCRSRRRDFHIQYGLVLPKAMLPGRYRLDLTMKDRLGDKRGNASIAFEIR